MDEGETHSFSTHTHKGQVTETPNAKRKRDAVQYNLEFDSLHFSSVGCGWSRVEYQASAIKEAQGCLCRRSLKEDSGLLIIMTMDDGEDDDNGDDNGNNDDDENDDGDQPSAVCVGGAGQ